MARDGERGYALLAAIVAVGALAYVAAQVLATNQGTIDEVAARIEQARLSAAADAGIDLAIHALASEDRTSRWPLDGRVHPLDFDGVDLAVVVEDERGKAPLNTLDDNQARALFSGAGATGDRLDSLVAEFRDWLTGDQAAAPSTGILGAAPGGAPPDIAPRHGLFRTVGELSALKSMDPKLFDRIAQAVTVFFEDNGGFEARNAQPLAMSIMKAQGGATSEAGVGEPSSAGQRTEEEIAPEGTLIGRTLAISVTARARDGSHTHRMAIVELTGDSTHPYWVRYVE